MKKLFTLLTLLVFLGGGKSWGQTTIFSYELPAIGETPIATYRSDMSGDLDATGGTISFGATSKFETSTVATNGAAYKLDGDAGSSNTKYVLITSDEILQEDDIITVTGYSTNATGYPFALCDVRAGTDKVATGTNCNKSLTASSYKVTASDCLNGNNTIYITRSTSSLYFYSITITRPAAKTVASEVLAASYAVKVDDTALTLNASTNGYSVSDNTITLSDNIAVTSAPTNVELVKTITYDDASTSDADVAVTFNGTVTAGYFIGTATIGLTGSETTYTVKVKKDATPTIALSAASGTISLNSYTPTGSQTVTLTGANLTNGTYNVTADVTGTTISPTSFTVADGEVSQEFTITSSASSAASTVFTFGTSAMGIAAPTYTLNYSKKAQRSVSQSTISAATTWNWTEAAVDADASIELSASTDPAREEDFLMAKLPEIVNSSELFNSEALTVSCQYPYRKNGSNQIFQGSKISFTTTVPGTIKVDFANTGGSRPYRYLNVNGINVSDELRTNSGTKITMTDEQAIPVPAGTVTIQGMFVDDPEQFYIPEGKTTYYIKGGNGTNDDFDTKSTENPYGQAQMLVIYKIVFTPLTGGDVVVMNQYEWATYVPSANVDFTGSDVKAYIVTGHTDNAINKTQVNKVEAGTPVLLNAPKGSYEIPALADAADATTGNCLYAGTGSSISAEAGKTKYVLSVSAGAAQFQKIVSTAATVPTGKAYLLFDEVIGDAREFLDIDIDGVSTGIKNMKVGSEDNVYYDLQGRRVLYPTKGLYIVNGKKVVIK